MIIVAAFLLNPTYLRISLPYVKNEFLGVTNTKEAGVCFTVCPRILDLGRRDGPTAVGDTTGDRIFR